MKYYTTTRIDKENADYNVIFGERSNGKTTAVLGKILKHHIESGYTKQGAIIRRWEEDFKGKNGQQMFDAINNLNWVSKWTNDYYNTIIYFGQRWFLAYYNEYGEKVRQGELPFLYGFSISSEEHYKSTSYPNVDIILFDEFITRTYYLPGEFVKFLNIVSTIVRLRDSVKIYMLGNTINKYCPYFKEMGLRNIGKMKKGNIDIYTYGESGLKVAVEFTDFDIKEKKSNKYFAFDNPKLNMIKHGSWEMAIYPHLPEKYNPNDVAYFFFIQFNDEKFKCDVVMGKEGPFIYIMRKTTPIIEDVYPVFSNTINNKRNWYPKFGPYSKRTKKINNLFSLNKVFYQDNEVGESIRNFIMTTMNKDINE